MAATGREGTLYRFGTFELDIRSGELRKRGVRLKLQDQPLQILLILLERAGQTVTREEIRGRLWREDTFVDFDNAINSAVRKLREVLGDSAENPRFVETLARRGYRFIAPIDPFETETPLSLPVAPAPDHALVPVARRRYPRAVLAGAFTLLAVGAVALFQQRTAVNKPDSEVSLPPPVPFTTDPGFQWSPVFSPEGTRAAFSWAEPETRRSRICVKLLASSEPVCLTSGEAHDSAPAWSRSGRTIAFLRAAGPFTKAVMLIPAVGGTVRELARIPMDSFEPMYYGRWTVSTPLIAWSPDDRWLLAIEQQGPEKPRRIVRISTDTGEITPLHLSLDSGPRAQRVSSLNSGESGLALSPDGETLAFLHTVESPDTLLYTIKLSPEMLPAGPVRSLRFGRSVCSGIAWDSNGHSLIVTSNRRGTAEFWKVPVYSPGQASQLNIADSFPRDLSISASGQHLLYTHFAFDWNIWRANLANQRVQSVTPLVVSTRNEAAPGYSPDGKRIVFESNRSGSEEIWVADADGSHPVQLTSFASGWAGSLRWSPDGSRIAFDSNLSGHWSIYTIPAGGGKAVQLTSASGSQIRPSWSHDGKWVYYCASTSSGTQIWKTPASGGEVTQVTKTGGCNQTESKDGATLYYLKDNNSRLWKIPVAGGPETEVAAWKDQARFTVAANGVYFTDSFAAKNLYFLDFRDGVVRRAGTLPGTGGYGMTLSPDERSLLFAKTEAAGSQLMLVEKFK